MKPVLAPSRPTTLPRLARAAIVVGIFSAYYSYVFQFSKGTLFRFGIGDWLDPYFINLLMEHWYTSLVTFSNPATLPIYFPVTGTLGYSHALILYAPFYVVCRPFMDPFQAWTAALFAVLVIGSSCLYLMLRWLGLRFVEAFVLAAFFATSPNVIRQFTSQFSQTASVFLIPMIGVVVMSSERVRRRSLRLALAALSGVLTLLLFAQEFYTGAFLVLMTALFVAGAVPVADIARSIAGAVRKGGAAFLAPAPVLVRPSLAWAVVAVVAAALSTVIMIQPLERTRVLGLSISARDASRPAWVAIVAGAWYAWWRWRLDVRLLRLIGSLRSTAADAWASGAGSRAGRWIAGRAPVLIAGGCGALIGGAVFLWIYLESFLTFRAFPDDHLWGRLHQPDVSRWTGPLEIWSDLWKHESPRALLLLIGFIALTWLPAFRGRPDLRRAGLWSLLVSAVIIAVALRFGDFSPWKMLVGWIPGFRVIRDPSRVIYLYDLAVVILVGLMLSRASRFAFRVAVLAVACAVMAADWNTRVFALNRSREAFANVVDAPIAVHPSCRSFFITRASRDYESRHQDFNLWGLYAIDSAFIALKYGLPTLNGYTAWQPDDWGLQEPHQPGYMKGVDEWIARHQLDNVCQLDIEARTMRPYKSGGL